MQPGQQSHAHRRLVVVGTAVACASVIVGTAAAWPDAGGADPAARSSAAGCTVTVLPTLGGRGGTVVATSGNGLSVGIAQDRSGQARAVIWRKGRAVRLGVRLDAAMPTGVNRQGVVVGTGFDRARQQLVGWWWAAGKTHLIAVRGGDVAMPEAIDDHGRVVGALVDDEEHADGPGADEDERAAYWPRVTSLPRELPPLPGDSAAHAAAIAGDGTVGGVSVGEGGRPVLWKSGRATSLPGLRGGYGQVRGFDGVGRPVGDAQGSGGMHAVVWGRAGGPRDLGTLAGGRHSVAMSGASGDAVGSSADPAPGGGSYDAPVVFRDGRAQGLPLPRAGGSRAVAGTAIDAVTVGRTLLAVGYSADAVGTRRPTVWRCVR
jgi:hypothetical protein